MPLPEAITYLRRYQLWRRHTRGQSLTVGGFDREAISQSIDILLNAAETTHILQQDLNSARSRLRKCQLKRHQYNLQLRSKNQPPCETPISSPPSSPPAPKT